MGLVLKAVVRPIMFCASLLLASVSSFAGVLEVSPINIEVSGGAPAVETLTNKGTTLINAQVRVFKWSMVDGQEVLEPTKDVVASPPALKIKPGAKATIRIVRLKKSPIVGEENYRLLVDDVPPPPKTKNDAVAFAIRHNIPVFYQAPGIDMQLSWKAKVSNGALHLSAANSGDLHARISQLKVTSGGVVKAAENGLVGYVLGGTSNAFKLKAKSLKPGSKIKIMASTNNGPVEATVQVQ